MNCKEKDIFEEPSITEYIWIMKSHTNSATIDVKNPIYKENELRWWNSCQFAIPQG